MTIPTSTSLRPKLSYREFLVDFFGALMPGILFFVFSVLGFIIPLLLSVILLENIFAGSSQLNDQLLEAIIGLKDAPTILLFVIFLILTILCYVIGTLYYRRDIKVPDLASFIKSASSFKEDELSNWVVKIKKDEGFITNPKNIKSDTVKAHHVQYPYNNLRGYLESRGRKDLSDKIPWSIENPNNRSKTFINFLKIRIQFYYPQAFNTMIKNEAHIRLTSTLWYVANTLSKFAFYGFVLLAATSFGYTFIKSSFPIFVSMGLLSSLIAYFFSKSAISNSEDFLHYQRVREIFFVLETARVASIEKKIDLFKIDTEIKF